MTDHPAGDDGARRDGGSPGEPANKEDLPLDDEDLPLDEAEAATGAAVAAEPLDETLDERVEAVIAELDGVERTRTADGVAFAAGGRLFAVLHDDRLEVGLDPAVATVALRTPDASASGRGAGWITFAPATHDRFALDRAEAWVRSAHRRAAPRA